MEQPLPVKKHFFAALKFAVLVSFTAFLQPATLFAQSPTLAYATPQTYTAGAAITPLAPTSSNVAAAGYSGTPVLLANTVSSPPGYTLPTCVAIGQNGGSNDILVSAGANILEIFSGLVDPVYLSNNGNINGLASDGHNRFFFTTNANNSVWEIDFPGGAPPFAIASGGTPYAITVDAASNIYYSDQVSGAITKIPAGGGSAVVIGNVSNPQFMTVDAARNVYVGSYASGMITEIPVGGGSQVQLNFGINGVAAMAADASGNVFVVDLTGNFYEIPAGGGSLVSLYSSGTSLPGSLAVDVSGNLYFTDPINGLVYELSPVGGYYLNTPLPSGLSFNNSTGVISGTPVSTSAAADYTITAYNSSSPGVSATVNITVGAAINSFGIADATPNNGSTVNYTAVFSGPVSGLTGGNFSLAPAGAISGETVGTPTTSDGGTTWTIPVSTGTGDGTVRMDLVNAAGVLPAITATLPFRGQSYYTIDKTPPVASPITFKSNSANSANAKTGDVITLSATFNEPVQTPVVTIGGQSVTPVNVSGNTWNATYTVTSSDPEGYISFDINAADLAGNTVEESSVLMGLYVTIDDTPPSVTSGSFISNNGTGITFAKTGDLITFSIGFTETVQTPTVTLGGHSVTMTNPFSNIWTGSYTVTPSDPGGLFAFDCNVADLAGNSAEFTSANEHNAYVTIDNTPPIAAISAPSAAGVRNNGSDSVSYTVTYADANFNTSNLTTSGITLNATGTATGTIGVTGSGTSYTVTISGISGLGTLGISVSAGYANDLAGNTDAGTGPSATFNVLSSDAALSALNLSAGTLSPVFDPGITGYTVNVANSVSAITLTPTTNFAGATVTVNGQSPATPVSLAAGQTIVPVAVTAQDGTTGKTYTVTVNRAKSNNDYLYAIGLRAPYTVLTKVSGPDYRDYTASVVHSVSSIEVLPTTADTTATVTVNGTPVTSGSVSAPVTLVVGANTITTVITAQDGATKTYVITVNRAGSGNASLYSIGLRAPYTVLTKVAGPDYLDYTASVAHPASSIEVLPTTADPNATVKVNGIAVTSGSVSTPIALAVGANTITTVITAQDGATQICVITINRAGSGNADLYSIGLRAPYAPITKVSGPDYLDYTASIAANVSTIEVLPVTADPTATVTVNGAAVTSGSVSTPIRLAGGANAINTVITAQDGTKQTCVITVTRVSSEANPLDQISVTQPNETPVLADDGIVVHKGVSPNGDGIEDFLTIDNIAQYPDNHVAIMNRNGQLIYETKGYDNSTNVFDGHSNKTGQMQLPGTYFFALDYTVNGIIKHKTGFLVLKY